MHRLVTIALLALLPAAARADVVHTEPCPFGARERTSHSGPRCLPWTCETDADCEGGLVCRPWRVCTQARDVPVGGRGAFRDPPPPPTREQQVLATCAPDASCTGDEQPRPPVRGQPVGEVRCEVAPHCVSPSFPPIPGAPPPPPAPEASGAPSVAAPVAEGRPVGGSACGCRAGSRASHVPPLALALIASLFVRRRR